jgi:L-amino acid N-acyltransferase YncA
MPREIAIRAAQAKDAKDIALVYNHGIQDRIATFETEERDEDDRRRWLGAHDQRHPVLVAEDETAEVVGWASVSAYSQRACYSGVGEYSVYVRRDRRGAGIGSKLLEALIAEASRVGYWKLISRIFVFNESSIRLARRYGFREVGVLQKHGRLDGRWVDVVEVERLFPENID